MSAPRVTNVFVAGASDCDDLRDATVRTFGSMNRSNIHEFKVFDWRRNTSFGNFRDFQEEIFRSAANFWGSPRCDILVLLLWHEFGRHTKQEYEYYIEKYSASQSEPTRLMACHFNGPVWPHTMEKSDVGGLLRWKKRVGKGWSEIVTERGVIQNGEEFHYALVERIDEYKAEFL